MHLHNSLKLEKVAIWEWVQLSRLKLFISISTYIAFKFFLFPMNDAHVFNYVFISWKSLFTNFTCKNFRCMHFEGQKMPIQIIQWRSNLYNQYLGLFYFSDTYLVLFEIKNILPFSNYGSNKDALNNNTKCDDLFSVHYSEKEHGGM